MGIYIDVGGEIPGTHDWTREHVGLKEIQAVIAWARRVVEIRTGLEENRGGMVLRAHKNAVTT